MNEDYYNGEEWGRTRERRINHDDRKCKNCGSSINLNVHHKNYSFQGREDIKEDLITLCKDCHSKITEINRNKRRRELYYGYKEESTFWW